MGGERERERERERENKHSHMFVQAEAIHYLKYCYKIHSFQYVHISGGGATPQFIVILYFSSPPPSLPLIHHKIVLQTNLESDLFSNGLVTMKICTKHSKYHH